MINGSIKALSAVIACLAALSAPANASNSVIGVASVIDGDTIEIHGQRIRLYGIDAPESRQNCHLEGEPYRCGQKAAAELDAFIAGASVRCDPKGMDRYKRVLAVCYRGEVDINKWLVENGWALAYRKYSKSYVLSENAAKINGSGIWGGEFMMPWDFRITSKRSQ